MKYSFIQSAAITAGILSCLFSPDLHGQTIPNPSFELDAFSVFPGYVSDNGPITGWAGGFPESHGLNPSAGSPFADNGTVPAGSQVAFVQSNSNFSTLETTISGLTPGVSYQLSFRVNARSGNTPILTVSVGGNPLLTTTVTAVGTPAQPAPLPAYRVVSCFFTAAAAAEALVVTNTANNDNTLVVDDFAVAPATAAWNFTDWTDDVTTGIDASYIYTHAYNFGSAAGLIINAVPFTGLAGGNPSVPGKLTVTGTGNVFNNDTETTVSGDSRVMSNDFIYNGFPSTLTLSGLVPGRAYLLSLFSVGWEDPGNRAGTFRAGTNARSMDQDFYGNNNGIRFDCTYTADASGGVTVTISPFSGNSMHLYGLANREAVLSPTPVITLQPQAAASLTGGVVRFEGSAAGAGPISYQWLRNGAAIPGETFADLEVTVTDAAAQSGFYRLRATNINGSTESQPAFLEVYVADNTVATFNTGVDDSRFLLFSGETDPHYILLENPDNPGIPDAISQDPIPAAWLFNGPNSNWIGPRSETSGAAGPNPTIYVYRTTIDLTGQATAGVLIGSWASDNEGRAIRLNSVNVPGAALSTSFAALTPFVVRTASLPSGTVTAGLNQLDFEVVNAGAGFTGLYVDGLSYARVPAGIAPSIYLQPTGGVIVTGAPVTLRAEAYGSGDLAFQWLKDGNPVAGATSSSYPIPAFSAALDGDYTVRVTNASGTAVSDPATLTASNVPPSITADPQGKDAAVGELVSFSVTVEGSSPFTYQWSTATGDIAGATGPVLTLDAVTRADSGTYKVRIENAYGFVTSAEAVLNVQEPVPGLFSTGVDGAALALGDGENDLHYTLLVNPGGDDGVPAVVHSSTVFPIVAGPWLMNTAESKWIAPQFDTVSASGLEFDGGEGPGVYVYRTTVDLSGFLPSSVSITGGWATDNLGTGIRVNGEATGLVNDAQFPVLTPFTISSDNATFLQGLNTIDFVVQNVDASVGYTGLRVQNLRGLGDRLPDLPALSIRLNGTGQPVISFAGNPGQTYAMQRSTALATGWGPAGTATADAGGAVEFTDTDPPAGRAFYRAEIPLP